MDSLIDQILLGDAICIIKTIPDDSIDCCVTSPPYWNLRQYLFDGAVVLDPALTEEEKNHVLSELSRLGIKPRL